ncbi:hypothetical protein C8R47DRAFT_1077131 [Mycena vitilis]|nr:hypothetical protein C8R47DRAFT_1077131 [Mycena vitilis]
MKADNGEGSTAQELIRVEFRDIDGQWVLAQCPAIVSGIPAQGAENGVNPGDLTHLYLPDVAISVNHARDLLRGCVVLHDCEFATIDNAEDKDPRTEAITLEHLSKLTIGLSLRDKDKTCAFFERLIFPHLTSLSLEAKGGGTVMYSHLDPNEFLKMSKASLTKLYLAKVHDFAWSDLGVLLQTQCSRLKSITLHCTGDWDILKKFKAADFPMLAQLEVRSSMPIHEFHSLVGFVEKFVNTRAPELRTLREVTVDVNISFPASVSATNCDAKIEWMEDQLRNRWKAVIAKSTVSLGVWEAP